jgi:hypothetical protein
VAYFPDEVEILKAEAEHDLKSALNAIKLKDRGKERPSVALGCHKRHLAQGQSK